MSRKAKQEAFVCLYRHELESAAYRSLSPDARSLLIEFRALYSPREGNRVFMSIREMQRRAGMGRWRAEKARDELLDRGFIRLLTPGGFSRKNRHASEFALTNLPLDVHKDGATAPKDYMKWTPPQKNTVLTTSTDCASHQHRGVPKKAQKGAHSAGHQHRGSHKRTSHGASHQHTDNLPGSSLFWGAMKTSGRLQLACLWSVLALSQPEQAAA